MRLAARIAAYHFRRHRTKLTIFVAATWAIAVLTALFLLPHPMAVVMERNGDTMVIREDYVGANLADFSNAPFFSLIVTVSALWLTGRERRHLISLSVTRRDAVLGAMLYLIGLSAAMAIAQFLGAVIGRGSIWIAGYSPSGHRSVAAMLTGNEALWWERYVRNLFGMIRDAGVYTLAGCLFVRWWKAILIAMGCGLAALIALISQINVNRYATEILEFGYHVVRWIVDRVSAVRYGAFANSLAYDAMVKSLTCLAATAAAYLVVRGVPAVK